MKPPIREQGNAPPDTPMEAMEEGPVVVRSLRREDLDEVIRLDARITGRRREEYFRSKLRENLEESGVRVSLAAEVEGAFRGFVLARVQYGEFGVLEPVAVLDTIGVHPEARHLGAGHRLMDQLRKNLRGLGVSNLRTEVDWDATQLLSFFKREGFRPAPRLCLDLCLEGRP